MIRGGSDPLLAMASMPKQRMGLPPRSLAADAHHCIMVPIPGAGSTEYKDVARDLRCHLGQARLRSSPLHLLLAAIATGRLVPDAAEPAAVLGPVKEWPGNAAGR